jgi:DNA-binding NarL/FixJ family response regulator
MITLALTDMKSIKPLKYQPTSNLMDTEEQILPYHKNIIIFIVDDDPLYLKSLAFQFNQNPNIKIETFLTGESCIEKLCLKPDVVILDYVLSTPDKDTLDGVQTLMIIKKTIPDTQVIMLSARESIEVATNTLKLGAFDYVIKNQNTFKNLKVGIKKILGIYSKEKELIVWDW